MDFWSDFEHVAIETLHLYECKVCAAIVNDWDTHIAWHNRDDHRLLSARKGLA